MGIYVLLTTCLVHPYHLHTPGFKLMALGGLHDFIHSVVLFVCSSHLSFLLFLLSPFCPSFLLFSHLAVSPSLLPMFLSGHLSVSLAVLCWQAVLGEFLC